MPITTKPDYNRIWANSADPADIVDPDTIIPGKFDSGWEAEIPPYEFFNFLQNYFCKGQTYLNEQGIGEWDNATTYPINSLTKGSDGLLYRAKLEQSNNDPTTDDGTNWVAYDATSKVLFSMTVANMIERTDIKEGSIVLCMERDNKKFLATTSLTDNNFNIIQSTYDTSLYFLLLEENEISTKAYGATSGDITNLMHQFALSTCPNKIISSGNFEITEDIEFLQGENSIYFDNPTITANGVYTNGVLIIGDNTTTLVGTLSSELYKGDRVIPFTGLSKEDIISLWDPNDYSYSGFRANYRKGEFCEINEDSDVSSTDVNESLIDNYSIGTEIYKLSNSTPNKIYGKLKIISSLYATRFGVIINQANYLDLSNFNLYVEQSTHALTLNRCFKVSGNNLKIIQSSNSVSGLDYGLIISNCQYVDLNGYFLAERHGCSTGGSNDNASIVNRFINIFGFIGSTGQGNVAGADFHGNTEYSSYGGRIQGLILSGHKNSIKNGSIVEGVPNGVLTPSILCAEMKSFDHDLSNIEIHNDVDPFTNSVGVLDCGGVSDAMTANTTIDGKLKLNNSKILCPNASVITYIRNRGSTANFDMDISGLEIIAPNASLGVIRVDTVSGNDMSKLVMYNFYDPDYLANAFIIPSNTKVEGLEECGFETISTLTSNSFLTANIVFTKKFPRAPNIFLSVEGNYLGTKYPVVGFQSVTSTGFTLIIATPDGTNFAIEQDRDICWRAALNG